MGGAGNRALDRQSSLWDTVNENFPVALDLNASPDDAAPQDPQEQDEVVQQAAASPDIHPVRVCQTQQQCTIRDM